MASHLESSVLPELLRLSLGINRGAAGSLVSCCASGVTVTFSLTTWLLPKLSLSTSRDVTRTGVFVAFKAAWVHLHCISWGKERVRPKLQVPQRRRVWGIGRAGRLLQPRGQVCDRLCGWRDRSIFSSPISSLLPGVGPARLKSESPAAHSLPGCEARAGSDSQHVSPGLCSSLTPCYPVGKLLQPLEKRGRQGSELQTP